MAGNVLPNFSVISTPDQSLQLVQQQLVRTLNPVFATPTLGGNLLTNQSLGIGTNSINHGLGRTLNGWQIVRQRAEARIWDSQDNNKTPTLTLSLNSDSIVSVDLYVF